MTIKLAKDIAIYAIASPLVLALISFLFPSIKFTPLLLFIIFLFFLNIHAFIEALKANKTIKSEQ